MNLFSGISTKELFTALENDIQRMDDPTWEPTSQDINSMLEVLEEIKQRGNCNGD